VRREGRGAPLSIPARPFTLVARPFVCVPGLHADQGSPVQRWDGGRRGHLSCAPSHLHAPSPSLGDMHSRERKKGGTHRPPPPFAHLSRSMPSVCTLLGWGRYEGGRHLSRGSPSLRPLSAQTGGRGGRGAEAADPVDKRDARGPVCA
jgi:hypothetical protein